MVDPVRPGEEDLSLRELGAALRVSPDEFPLTPVQRAQGGTERVDCGAVLSRFQRDSGMRTLGHFLHQFSDLWG